MKKALGYGLVLLAASAAATRRAQASADSIIMPGAESGANFLLSGSGSGTAAARGQGYLGVDVRDVTEDQLSTLKLKETHGAEITLVDHDAPAGKAGLREHDVVLQMNGQPIEGREQIRRMLHESPPGRTIVLLISRDGQQMTVTTQMANQEEVERQAWEQHLTVTDQPSDAVSSDASSNSASPSPVLRGNSFIGTILMSPSYTGAMLEKMSGQLATYFGSANGSGLLVRSVAANSPAAIAGMHAGDVVVSADNRPVASTSDWAKALKNSHGHPLTVVVLRDKKEETLTLTPDGKRRSSLEEPQQDSTAIAGLS